jgi:hypothetical protein
MLMRCKKLNRMNYQRHFIFINFINVRLVFNLELTLGNLENINNIDGC